MDQQEKTRVLFVCIGNACRSPMGEAIARQDAGDVIEALSAGIYPMGMIPETTRRILEQNGYSATGLRSKSMGEVESEEIDLVVNLSGYARAQALQGFARVEEWPVSDPYGADDATYQRILEEIRGRVNDLAQRLRAGPRAAV